MSATEAKSASAPFILSDLPFLKTYPWFKATWTYTNSGGQDEAAGFSAYLVTSTGVLHADDLQSFLGLLQGRARTEHQSSLLGVAVSRDQRPRLRGAARGGRRREERHGGVGGALIGYWWRAAGRSPPLRATIPRRPGQDTYVAKSAHCGI
jgi:hypothetical protein